MLCTYEKTIYKDTQSGYMVCVVRTGDASVPEEARSRYHNDGHIHFTVTGYQIPECSTINLELTGSWKPSRYGLQLVVESFEECIPKTKAGIIGYLSSGLIKGIGTKTAKAMVDAYGLDTLDVLENEPQKLLSIKGITQKKLDGIQSSYMESIALKEVVAFLSPFGITTRKCAAIRKEFGDDTMRILREEPFRLCEISGFGFKTVDSIARKVHCQPDDPLRIRGAILFTLDESSVNGHVFLPQQELCRRAAGLLNEDFNEEVVDSAGVAGQLYDLIVEGTLSQEDGNIYKKYLYSAENDTATSIISMLQQPPESYKNLDDLLSESQKNLGILLSEKQCDAVRSCMEHPISIVTGGPGTGKTTVLKVILDVYDKLIHGTVLQAAPTGRASRRMMESTGIPASTLHSALGLISSDEEETFTNSRAPLETNFIIIDEMSMVDILLARELFTRILPKTKVLLVGDANQLPSVGPGNVFRDLISSGLIPVTKLDVVFRQAGTSRIAMNAQYIQDNKTHLLYGSDFSFEGCTSDAEAADLVEQLYLKAAAEYGIDHVQVLAPFKKRGNACVEALNLRLRDQVNPPRPGIPEYKSGRHLFRLGDRVLQTKNKDEISNGDVGLITDITVDPEDNSKAVCIDFSDGRTVTYGDDDMDNVELAYAMTIHKSQGSEYAAVIMPLLTSHYIMLRRNLIYTGITRAKKKVILIGQKQALFMAIHKNDTDSRNSLLGFRISKGYYLMRGYLASPSENPKSEDSKQLSIEDVLPGTPSKNKERGVNQHE